jgi:DNA adenine methylase Dam
VALHIGNYAGSKMKFIGMINFYINQSRESIYVEPFTGSASVFLNLQREFDAYYINDINPFMAALYRGFQQFEWGEFVKWRDEWIDDWGDFRYDKDSYYRFRNYANTLQGPELGIAVYYIMKTCINGLFRVNWQTMTMNQGFGRFHNELDEESYNKIRKKMQRATVTSVSYQELEFADAFYFLDPPYTDRDAAGYDIRFFNKPEMLEWAKDKSFLYTDVIDPNLQYKYKILQNDMKNSGPNAKSSSGKTEVLYINLK